MAYVAPKLVHPLCMHPWHFHLNCVFLKILGTLFTSSKWINGVINPNISYPWYYIGILVCLYHSFKSSQSRMWSNTMFGIVWTLFSLNWQCLLPTHPPNNNTMTTCYHMVNSNGQFHHVQFGRIFLNSL